MNIRRGSVTIRDIFLTQKKTMFSLNFTYIFVVKQKSGDLGRLKNCPKQNLNKCRNDDFLGEKTNPKRMSLI